MLFGNQTETVAFNPATSEGDDYDMYDYTDYSFSSEREADDTIAEPSETMFSARTNGSISDQIAAEPLQVPTYCFDICPSLVITIQCSIFFYLF